MIFFDWFRRWRRTLKSALPYVRRREYRILQRTHAELIDALDGRATAAAAARLQVMKVITPGLTGEVCFFVSFANQSALKSHVSDHVTRLLDAGIQVILILNSDLAATSFAIENELKNRLSGLLFRENIGFDFGAWAHAFSLCDGQEQWTRLYLVNDSIVGPLTKASFGRMIERVRDTSTDVLGLTECHAPRRHLQSYFLVFNIGALRSDAMKFFFRRVLNWPSKSQVIEVYEMRLTALFEAAGLQCEALFPPLSNDIYSSNDTSFRWAELVAVGFPYLKTSVIANHPSDRRIVSWLAAMHGDSPNASKAVSDEL